MRLFLSLISPFLTLALTPPIYMDILIGASIPAAQMSMDITTDGNFIFCWEGLSNAIQCQIFNQEMNPLSSEILVNSPISGTNLEP